MRIFLLSLAAGALMCGAANAQFHRVDPATDTSPGLPHPNAPDPNLPPAVAGKQSATSDIVAGNLDMPRAVSDAGAKSYVAANAREFPVSWQGTTEQWIAHRDACARLYRNYDANTDMFPLRPGVKAYCPAATGLTGE